MRPRGRDARRAKPGRRRGRDGGRERQDGHRWGYWRRGLWRRYGIYTCRWVLLVLGVGGSGRAAGFISPHLSTDRTPTPPTPVQHTHTHTHTHTGCDILPDGSLHCGKGSSLLGQQGFVSYGDPAAQAIAAQVKGGVSSVCLCCMASIIIAALFLFECQSSWSPRSMYIGRHPPTRPRPIHSTKSNTLTHQHTQAGAAAQLAALQGQEHAQGEPAYKPGTLHMDVDQHDFHEVRKGFCCGCDFVRFDVWSGRWLAGVVD